MKIRLPQRVLPSGRGSLGQVRVPQGGAGQRAAAQAWGRGAGIANKLAQQEKRKHLQAIQDDYTARIGTEAENKIQALQELQGEELGKLDRPGMSAKYAKDATETLEKEVQKMVEPLNEEEKLAATSQLNPILHSYNKGVHRYVAREQEQYQEKSYKAALANNSVNSARDSLGSMPAPDGSGRRVVRYKYWDSKSEMRIQERAKDRGWSKEETAAQKLAYYNSAVTDRVSAFLTKEQTGVALQHLEVMRNKIDPEIYLRLKTKVKTKKDWVGAQGASDTAFANRKLGTLKKKEYCHCLLYTSPSPRD